MNKFNDDKDDLNASAIAQQPPSTKQGGCKTSNLAQVEERSGFWCGVDYLTVSHPRHFHPHKICREIEQLFQSSGEATVGEHGYEGKDICGGYGKVLQRSARHSGDGDVLVRLPGRALDWIRDINVLSDTDSQCTDAEICRYFLDFKFLRRALISRWTPLSVSTSCGDRRRMLEDLALDGSHWKTPANCVGSGLKMRDFSREHKLEGIVAKRLDSVYEFRTKFFQSLDTTLDCFKLFA